MPAHASWYGHAISDIEFSTGARVAFVNRLGSGMIPAADSVLQDGDLVHVLVGSDDAARVEEILAGSRETALTALREGSS